MAKSPTKSSASTAAAPEVPTFRYEDRPDLLETFADNVQRMTFDGRTLRSEFCVTRPGEEANNRPAQGRTFPICRLVLDLNGAVDLFNKINSLQSALERQGVIRKTPGAGAVNQ